MLKFNIEEYLDSLPEYISEIDVSYNRLTYLPDLSRFKNLQILDCSDNNLTSLPKLNEKLQILKCYNNQIISLPELNENLEYLRCSNNNLSLLPKLNKNLQKLWCSINKLTLLPKLNENLNTLGCSFNNLIILPELNENLKMLFSSGNKLPNILNIDTTELTNIERNTINRFIKCKYRIMCLKYKNHFRRWLWERVRLPKIEKQYLPNNLLEILNNMKNENDEEEFIKVVETW